MKKFILSWAILAVAVMIVANTFAGIQHDSIEALVVASLVLGLLNMLVRPLLVMLTLPLTVISFGLFIFVLNGLLFYFAGSLVEGLYIDSLETAIKGALLISIVSWILNKIVRKN